MDFLLPSSLLLFGQDPPKDLPVVPIPPGELVLTLAVYHPAKTGKQQEFQVSLLFSTAQP